METQHQNRWYPDHPGGHVWKAAGVSLHPGRRRNLHELEPSVHH
jgi:hypothetical protein